MANTDRPNGLKVVRHMNGGTAVPVTEYSVDVSNGTAIFIGDAMILEADGNVAPYTGSGGGSLLGVCTGIKGGYDNLTTRHLAASTAGTVFVSDDPDAIYECQEDDAGTALTSDDRGVNCDVLATAGDANSGMSRHEIDRSSTTTTSAQLRCIRLVPRENNDYGDSAKWEVMINEHVYKTTAGV